MNIRKNLALKFCLIVATLFIVFAGSLYYFSNSYRELMFNIRMKNKGINATTMLVDINPIDSALLGTISLKTKSAMFDAGVYIFDIDNELIYTNSKDKKDEQIKSTLSKISSNNGDIKFRLGKKEAIGFLYSIKGKQFKVIVSAYDKYGLENILHLKIILSLGILLSVLVSYFAGWFFAGYALIPISKIISDVDEISVSNLNIRLNEGNKKDEMAQLAITFNKMLDRLKNGFEMQRSFISNASHELRTPLTSMNGHIEVTLRKTREKQEYIELLESLLEDIKSLSKISNNLLDLAFATTDINMLHLKNMRIDETLFSAREKIIKYFPTYQVSIKFLSFPQQEESLVILGNDQLIESAFFNLMENACKYSANHAVEVYLSLNNKTIELSFKDNGIGIPHSEIPKITEPFYRATNVKDLQGNGLGLSLIHEIIKLHGGLMEIDSKENIGTSVKILFPIGTFLTEV